MTTEHQLTPEKKEQLFSTLQQRFEKNSTRHPNGSWYKIEKKLKKAPESKLTALLWMEESGGEPDVLSDLPGHTGVTFVDCAIESPKGRRSLCYDNQALEARKKHKPKGSATDLAETMGIQILSEEQYAHLQQTGAYDNKTSSWLDTPQEVRELGGAIFGDRRFGRVFTYHNGADSYYGSRGFRGALEI